MTVTQTLLCHPSNPEELNGIFYDIAKEHGWKPANVAHKLLWAFTSNGTRFLAAKNKATGESLGYIIIPQHENASYIGYFIVRESKRGQGFGKQLFTKALEMATLEPVYLFSVENMIEKYKTMGFNTTGRKIGWYYTPCVDRSGLQTTPLRENQSIVDLHSNSDVLSRLDTKIGGWKRESVWKIIASIPEIHMLGLKMENEIIAAVLARPIDDGAGYQVGPLWVDEKASHQDAINLMGALLERFPEKCSVSIATLVNNKHAVEIVEMLKLQCSCVDSEMVKGEALQNQNDEAHYFAFDGGWGH